MSQPIGPSQPSIGRIVRVVLHNGVVPAIITAVTADTGIIACTAFPPNEAPIPMWAIGHDEAHAEGTWHWPVMR